MQILADYGHEYDLTDVTKAIHPKHAWYYDVGENDFMLKPILLLEETTGPTVTVKINTVTFKVPASWHLLIVDDDSRTVDTVLIGQCANSSFKAYMMHPSLNRYESADVQLLDLDVKGVVTHLSVPRLAMVCCPVGSTSSSGDLPMNVLFSPQDVGKFMVNMSAQGMLL